MPREKDIAHAYSLQQEAFLLPDTSKTRVVTFTQAAERFIQCATASPSRDEGAEYYRQAGRCFTECSKYQQAGDVFLNAEEYTLSAQAYRKADMFDTAIHVVKEHPVEPGVANHIIAVTRLHYFLTSSEERAVE